MSSRTTVVPDRRPASSSRWRSSREPEAGAAPVVVHPHPLDLADRGPSSRTPPHATGRRRWWRPRTRRAGPGRPGRPPRPPRVEAVGEAGVELGEVLADRGARRRRARVDLDAARPSPPAPAGRRSPAPRSAGPLALGQRLDQPGRELLGPVVEPSPDARPRPGQRHHPPASVGRVRAYVDQPALLERPQLPGQVAGVQAQPRRAGRGRVRLRPAPISNTSRASAERQPSPRNDSSSAPIRWV